MPEECSLIKDLVSMAAELTLVSEEELLGPARQLRIIRVRHAVWYVLTAYYQYSSVEIGRAFKRDHTTVLSGLKAHARRRRSNPALARLEDRLVKLLWEAVPALSTPVVYRLCRGLRDEARNCTDANPQTKCVG